MGAACGSAPVECRRCIDPESGTTGQAARLVDAARAGDATTVQSVAREGANVNTADSHGWTALHYGSAAGSLEVCRALVDHCGDVNATLPDFSTPLMLAVEEGHLPVAKFLLDNGAHSKVKDDTGFTAQDRCDQGIRVELQKLLQLPMSDRYRKADGTAGGS